MEDVIVINKQNLTSIKDELDNITKELLQPSQFLQSNDESTLNSEIGSVFHEASTILKGADLDIEIAQQDFDSPISFLNFSKLQLERLNTEIERRIRLFDKSLLVARQICNDRVEKIQMEYKNRIDGMRTKNKAEEKKLNEQLLQIQQSFETRLHTQIAKYLRERNSIESQLSKLKTEFNLTETTLTTSLAASQMRSQLLEKQRDMLKETNSQVSSTISDKFDQQMRALQSKHQSKIQAIEIDNNRLSAELKLTKENFSSDLKKFSSDLENIEVSHANHIESLINQEKLAFEKKKRKINSKHHQIVDDLKHELEIERISSENEIQLLKTEIEIQEQFLKDSDKRYNDSIDDIESKKCSRMSEIDYEMRLLAKIQTKTLKQLAQKHELDLEQEAHDAIRARQDLDQKIIQTQRDAELTRKKLESQITALTRAKDRFEEEIKVALTTEQKHHNTTNTKKQTTLKSSGHIVELTVLPQKLSQKPEIEKTLQDHITKFTNASDYEIAAIEMVFDAVKSQAETEKQRFMLKIEETQQDIISLNSEKEEIKAEIAKIEADLSNSHSFAIKEQQLRISELQKQIEAQESTIIQLKDDLQSKRADGVKKVDISVIQDENESEIKKMKNIFEKMKTNLNLKLHEIEVHHENEISKEQMKTQDIIDSYRQRLQEINNETKRTKEEFEVKFHKNFQEWSETRKEIEMSLKQLGKTPPVSRSGSRPGSSASALPSLSPGHSPLPRLRK
ncbi:hypothetical protein TRFO_41535 [Tritrichomonas foetus]|uniref:Uncharacterized protein n=1 Tax=Tritrichomonas foetus TaxID=1144522 RepID=A0A1J4L4I7_9EUKA|nr:hypothetical protein TRFO_41535 [Tritrichomonas foetus]|eukprot:OHT16845.1 hypothetical protein TRFO_41535 [Tritrichomonas foetus]